jgi:hypothetical protein
LGFILSFSFQLGLLSCATSISRLNLIQLQPRFIINKKADEGGHGGDDEDGIQGFGILACFLAGWLGQSGGNTAWVAGSCTVSGWASLAGSVVSCWLWLGSGELGNGSGAVGVTFPSLSLVFLGGIWLAGLAGLGGSEGVVSRGCFGGD